MCPIPSTSRQTMSQVGLSVGSVVMRDRNGTTEDEEDEAGEKFISKSMSEIELAMSAMDNISDPFIKSDAQEIGDDMSDPLKLDRSHRNHRMHTYRWVCLTVEIKL